MSHSTTDRTAADVDDAGSGRDVPIFSVATTLITVAGIVGATILACIVTGWAFGLSILVFATGSMAPTMPTGTAAVVQHTAAADVAVGDVVTVPRPGETMPVTHRVVSIADVAGDDLARSLVLRGDANSAEDRDPYVVRDVERVLVAAPGAGTALGVVQSPLGIGVTASLVVMGVLWAFWPEQRRHGGRHAAPITEDA